MNDSNSSSEVYWTNFDNGDVAIVFVNWGNETISSYNLTLESLNYNVNGGVNVKNLWSGE